MPTAKRIRDPIHGLIRFEAESEVDQLAWQLLDAPEVQRLRAIKQLGFLHLVFPGATHTRFAHSIGVYSVARKLLDIIARQLGPADFDAGRARVAALSALLHDVGHGPLSHVFEKAEHSVLGTGVHERWSVRVITGDTAVFSILERATPGLARQVADELSGKGPRDIYSAVVASHFDADRLDYLERDRQMTGLASASIDLTWLLDSLRVEDLPDQWGGGAGLVLAPKGLRAAEEYLLARINLYRQIYLHKTSRGAELMMAALAGRLAGLITDGRAAAIGLAAGHPLLAHFGGKASLASFLALDDEVLGGALADLEHSDDAQLAELASRLRRRRIYKCFDAGQRIRSPGGPELSNFAALLRARAGSMGLTEDLTLLTDAARVDAISSFGQHGPRSQRPVLVRASPDGPPVAIVDVSPLVAAIAPEEVMRFYVPTDEHREAIWQLWRQTMHRTQDGQVPA